MAKKKKTYTELERQEAYKKLLLFGGISIGLFILDVVTKWVVQLTCTPGQLNPVIPNFFYITLSYNTGAAFSLGANWGIGGRILGIAISLIMSFVIIYYWIRKNIELKNFERVIFALMAAGAVGNLIDRSFYFEATTGFNGVIDFLQFYLGGGPNVNQGAFLNPFATFNLADAYLVVGIIMFIILTIIETIRDSSKSELRTDPRLAKKKEEEEEEDEEEEEEEEEEPKDSLEKEEAPSKEEASKEEPSEEEKGKDEKND